MFPTGSYNSFCGWTTSSDTNSAWYQAGTNASGQMWRGLKATCAHCHLVVDYTAPLITWNNMPVQSYHPNGWLSVAGVVGFGMAAHQVGYQFCSLSCLIAWSAATQESIIQSLREPKDVVGGY